MAHENISRLDVVMYDHWFILAWFSECCVQRHEGFGHPQEDEPQKWFWEGSMICMLFYNLEKVSFAEVVHISTPAISGIRYFRRCQNRHKVCLGGTTGHKSLLDIHFYPLAFVGASLEPLAGSNIGVSNDDTSDNLLITVQVCPQVSCTFTPFADLLDIRPGVAERKRKGWRSLISPSVRRIRHVDLFRQRVVYAEPKDANVVSVGVVMVMMVGTETN